MSTDSLIGIIAVVIGTILGYLASYLNNRQQRKWQLDSEKRAWKRAEIEKDMEAMFKFIQKYVSLANVYIESAEKPNDRLLKEFFEHTKSKMKEYMKDEGPFPIGLKSGSTKNILEDLDKVTDDIVEIALDNQVSNVKDMKIYLENIRELEKSLYTEKQKLLMATFS